MFQAGTKFDTNNKQLLTAGGRVLCTVAVSSTLEDARRKAYEAVQQISFEKAYYRKDIANRALRFVRFSSALMV